MVKRIFDVLFSILGLIILFPVFIVTGILIKLEKDGGPVFFNQKRVGKADKDFTLHKFRTMRVNTEKEGYLTVGNKDRRITAAGDFLRRYKIDELPQLFNVLKGDMSFVGPRPEVRKYVMQYNKEQLKVLEVRPGITDVASIAYRNENEILAKAEKPEEFYIKEIMPEKIKLNLEYIKDRSFFKDVKVIMKTLGVIFRQ